MVLALFLVLVLGFAAPAWTQQGGQASEPVIISGRVNGDVVAFNGRIELRSGANVTGDVVSQQAPVVALVPILGGLVWFAAVVIGLGALALAIWRARSASQATAAQA